MTRAYRATRRVLSALGRPLRVLASRIGARPTSRVRFPSDAELIGALKPGCESVRPAVDRFAAGDAGSARRLLASHFRDRTTPRTFVDRTSIGALLGAIDRAHPPWRRRSRDFAAAWCSRLGDMYGTSACRGGGIDWDNLRAGPGNDHLYRDRLHHFAFAPLLARASLYGADVDDALRGTLLAWIRSTERARQPDGYSGCLIVAYRIVALAWTHAFLACRERSDELEFEVLRILLSDTMFIAERLGTSFRNNHLLADGFVLWLVGMLYPEFAEANSWLERGEEVWLRELGRQVFDDGASFEHATHYQSMACEMAVSYVVLNRLNRRAYPDWVDARTRAMLVFHREMSGPGGAPFEFGDGVEDPLLPLGDVTRWGRPDYSGLLGTLFGEAMGPAARPDDDEGAFWIAGGNLRSGLPERRRSSLACFPQGGAYVFDDADARARLLFRSGPVDGLPANPGHMHADLLSIQVHVDGVPIIVDPGTYTYRSGRERWAADSRPWRRYFMSAEAHSGLAIDGADPLERGGGDFPGRPIRSHAAVAAAVSGDAIAWVHAEHRGDTAYRDHHRGVVQVRGHYHVVYDVLPPSLPLATLSFGLQFGAGVQVMRQGESGAVRAHAGETTLGIVTSENLRIDAIASGQGSPMLGWVSPRYGELRDAPMIRYGVRQREGPLAMVLSARDADVSRWSIQGRLFPRAGYAFRVATDRHVDHLFLSTGEGAEEIAAWGIRFTGGALWLRTSGGRLQEMRWLGGRRAIWPEQGLDVRATGPSDEFTVRVTPSGHEVTRSGDGRVAVAWLGEPLA